MLSTFCCQQISLTPFPTAPCEQTQYQNLHTLKKLGIVHVVSFGSVCVCVYVVGLGKIKETTHEINSHFRLRVRLSTCEFAREEELPRRTNIK